MSYRHIWSYLPDIAIRLSQLVSTSSLLKINEPWLTGYIFWLRPHVLHSSFIPSWETTPIGTARWLVKSSFFPKVSMLPSWIMFYRSIYIIDTYMHFPISFWYSSFFLRVSYNVLSLIKFNQGLSWILIYTIRKFLEMKVLSDHPKFRSCFE